MCPFILGGDLYFPRQVLKSFPLYLSAHKRAENGHIQPENMERVKTASAHGQTKTIERV